jgi:hypothetical protein
MDTLLRVVSHLVQKMDTLATPKKIPGKLVCIDMWNIRSYSVQKSKVLCGKLFNLAMAPMSINFTGKSRIQQQ